MRGCEAHIGAESREGISSSLREPTGEKAGIVTDGDEETMVFRMAHSKGCSRGAGNQANPLKGKISGDDSAPPVCPEPNPWRCRHQWTESDGNTRIVIIA